LIVKKRPRALFAISVVLLGFGVEPAVARADAPPKNNATVAEAKRLFDEGAELYGTGKYDEAIERWEISYELSKRPLIFESIANAYERLGNAKKAREYLAKWREAAPAEEHETLDARIANLDARIAKETEAEAARAKGSGGGGGSDGPAARSMQGDVGLALAGAGGGVLALGVTLAVVGAAQRPDQAEVCKDRSDRSLCLGSAREDIESSSTLVTLGDVLGFVGFAMAGAGVALVILDEPDSPKTTGIRLTPAILTGGGGASVGGSF